MKIEARDPKENKESPEFQIFNFPIFNIQWGAVVIRLVAFDLDGTVLDGTGTPSDSSLKAIREMQSKGIALSTMSGRNVDRSLAAFQGEAGLTDEMHCGAYNGSVVVGPSEGGRRNLLFEQRIPVAVLPDLVGYIRDQWLNFIYYQCLPHPTLGVEEQYLSDRRSESTDILVNQVGADFTFDPALSDRVLDGDLGPPPKIVILPGENRRDDEFQRVSARFGDQLYIARTDSDRVEFMHPRINKWTAVERIGRLRGIDESGILAIGDGENDIPMIQNAGIGVVMGNAEENLKKLVDGERIHLAPGFEEEGFFAAMRKYVLV